MSRHLHGATIERPEAIEHKDVSPRGIFIFLGGLLAALVATLIFVSWLFGAFSTLREEGTAGTVPHVTEIPEPRIQRTPLVDIYNLHRHEDSILNSYGWVQPETGIARIPIERAMELLAARGLPARTGADPGPTVPETGPESGGPQTGAPMPRFNRPPGLEPSNPPPAAPVPGPPVPRTSVPSGAVTEANR